MTSVPVQKSKLIAPYLPTVIAAPDRLEQLCTKIYDKNLTIITAPAGYGKTTLMVTAINKFRSTGCRICWYRLDENDQDLAVFYTHLAETLFPREEGFGDAPHSHLAACGDIFTQYRFLNALICQELWALYSQSPTLKTFIVFDDFQYVSVKQDIANAIQLLIDNLPDTFSLIISSRSETGLATGKRRLEKNVLEIDPSALSFSEEELARFIYDQYGFIPGRKLLHKIMMHTEGWPAGIVLACQMLSGGGADEADDILDRFGRREVFFKYMIAEILKTVDHDLLRFLTKATILRDFTKMEAETILEEKEVHRLLEQCEQKGMFIQKIPGTNTTYRFHSLFREALIQHQYRCLSTEEVNAYHLKAAAYYIRHRLFDRAVEHFITCGDIYSAVALVTGEGTRLVAFGAVDQLRIWFRFLPDELVSGNGYLLFFKSFIHYQRDIAGAQNLLQQALAIFNEAGDSAMQIHTLVAMAHLHVQDNNIPGIKKINKRMKALSQKVEGTPLQDMLKVFDFTVSVWEENFARGIKLYRRVKSLPMVDEWRWMVLFYSAVMYGLLGDLNQAECQLKEAQEIGLIKKADLLRGYIQTFYAIILMLKDEQDALARITEELEAIGEKYDYKIIQGFGKRLEAVGCYLQNNLASGLDLLDTSTVYFEQLENSAMVSFNTLLRCLWLCDRNNPPEFLAIAKKAIKNLLAKPSGLCHRDIGLSIFGIIAREAGDYKLAEINLSAAAERARAKGAKQVFSGSCLHLAKLRYDTGDQAGGDEYLRQGLEVAAENKYLFFWDLHFPTLVEMAARCIRKGICTVHARALINRYYGNEALSYLERNAQLTAEEQFIRLTEDFLLRYSIKDESKEPSIFFNLLGIFSIAINGVIIPNKEWKTKKIAGILKYLLTHRGKPVSRDQLMDVFWPDADKRSAAASLRAALYELKKVLRKYDVAAEGKVWLLNERRDNLEVRIGNTTLVDVDMFLAIYAELRKLTPGKNVREKRKILLERMVELYRGDFLEEDIYEDWTYAEREELRSAYLTAVNELAAIYLDDRDNRTEKLLLKALTIDPYNESACHCLLRLYLGINQKSKAAKLYSSFVNRFKNDLGIMPDEKITQIFGKRE